MWLRGLVLQQKIQFFLRIAHSYYPVLTHSSARSDNGPNESPEGKNAAILYEGFTGPTMGIVTPPGKIGSRNNEISCVSGIYVPTVIHCFP